VDDDAVLGYVASFVSAGQFFIQDISNALVVSFENDLTGSGTQLNLVPEVGFGSPRSRDPFLCRLCPEFEGPGLRLLGSRPGLSQRKP
jgi:hypothetical protein